MDREKVCLVIHPKAEQHVADILTILEERWETTHLVTSYAGHGIEIAAHAHQNGYRQVIAYGGDGTLNEVVNGAMQAQEPSIIGVLPGGTVNQWVHEIGLPAHPVEAARALIRSTPRRVDIGFVEVQALSFLDEIHRQPEIESKSTARHHFLLVAGLGFDAATIKTTSESSKKHYGQLAFMLAWLQTLPETHPFPVQVRWSTRQFWEGQPWEVVVSNTRRYSTVENLIPDAYVNDGLLDIRIFSILSPERVLFRPFQDHSFSLRVPASIAIELDGSSMQLADYVSRENWERIVKAIDKNKVMITYQFNVNPSALPMMIPQEYAGELFNSTSQRETAANITPLPVRVITSHAPLQTRRGSRLRATLVSHDPLAYVQRHDSEGPPLHMADVIVRENNDPKEIFARVIRFATGSAWSHATFLYKPGASSQGWNDPFLVEANTNSLQLARWRDEVTPSGQFTAGIKRLRLDWYVDTPQEAAQHDPGDPEDVPGSDYLRQVGAVALDQINGLYDDRAVYELTALYLQRIIRRHLAAASSAVETTVRQLEAIPNVSNASEAIGDFFRKWETASTAAALDRLARWYAGTGSHISEDFTALADLLKQWQDTTIGDFFKQWEQTGYSPNSVVRFISSGLVQYSFFEALRRRIMHDLAIPAHRDAAISNLSNMHRVIFSRDAEDIISTYVQQIQSGTRALSDPVPGEMLALLKTTTPADFNDTPNLEWQYIILNGAVWHISSAPDDYTPQSMEEEEVLTKIAPDRHLS